MSCSNSLRYLTDTSDHPEAMVIPLADWQHLRGQY